MHTEDEAKTKWCPHVRLGSVDARPDPDDRDSLLGKSQPSKNRQFVQDFAGSSKLDPVRLNYIPSGTHCIASKCMAWRWVVQLQLPIDEGLAPSTEGYCGLAGR